MKPTCTRILLRASFRLMIVPSFAWPAEHDSARLKTPVKTPSQRSRKSKNSEVATSHKPGGKSPDCKLNPSPAMRPVRREAVQFFLALRER